MATAQENALTCTNDMVDALESMIEGDGNLAVIYGNSAIAAVMILFERYKIEKDVVKPLFEELWSGIVPPGLSAAA